MDQFEVRLLISPVVVLNCAARLNKVAIPTPEQKSGTNAARVAMKSIRAFLPSLQFCGSSGLSVLLMAGDTMAEGGQSATC